MKVKKILLIFICSLSISPGLVFAKTATQLNDLEIAHVAYTASNIDIRYAHLALALSQDIHVRNFAKTMIRDHTAVNVQALALLKKLGANAQNNFLSRSLQKDANKIIKKMARLRGKAFDRQYVKNELGYHKAVNKLVEFSFIPNIKNAEVKTLFRTALQIFKTHESHARSIVKKVN